MAGISSQTLPSNAINRIKFNGIELNNDLDINMYDAYYRNLDPQVGRFWQLDPKPSDSISLYSFAFNNPMRYADALGDTAIVGLNKSSALFAGHQILIFQDKSKNWFVYSVGAATGTPADDQGLVSGDNSPGTVTLKPLNSENFPGLPESPLTVNQITTFLQDNKLGDTNVSDVAVVNTTQKQDETISKNAIQSKEDFESGKQKYNLYSNNSTHITMGIVNRNTGLNLPVGTHPSINHGKVVEYLKLQSMTPQQRQQYQREFEKKAREQARRMNPGKI